MKEFVGVRDPLASMFYPSLKRDALLFSRITIPIHNLLIKLYKEAYPSIDFSLYERELDWLTEQGILFDSKANLPDGVIESLIRSNEDFRRYTKLFIDYLKPPEGVDGSAFRELLSTVGPGIGEVMARLTSIRLKEAEQKDAYPILRAKPSASSFSKDKKEVVIEIALNELPIPEDSVPWEQIIEYRSDPDSYSKFLAIRNWFNEISCLSLSSLEIEQKLEYLIDQYQQHMKLHKMKANVGTLQIFVTTTAEILGDLVSFKWGRATNTLFSLKQRKIALLEGELTAPGNEVAYIIKARETFS